MSTCDRKTSCLLGWLLSLGVVLSETKVYGALFWMSHVCVCVCVPSNIEAALGSALSCTDMSTRMQLKLSLKTIPRLIFFTISIVGPGVWYNSIDVKKYFD